MMTTDKRCDQCGAQAYVSVLLDKNQAVFLFCGNHWRRNEERLTPIATVDDSALTEMRRMVQSPPLSVDA